jgi:hypothetical protein
MRGNEDIWKGEQTRQLIVLKDLSGQILEGDAGRLRTLRDAGCFLSEDPAGRAPSPHKPSWQQRLA